MGSRADPHQNAGPAAAQLTLCTTACPPCDARSEGTFPPCPMASEGQPVTRQQGSRRVKGRPTWGAGAPCWLLCQSRRRGRRAGQAAAAGPGQRGPGPRRQSPLGSRTAAHQRHTAPERAGQQQGLKMGNGASEQGSARGLPGVQRDRVGCNPSMHGVSCRGAHSKAPKPRLHDVCFQVAPVHGAVLRGGPCRRPNGLLALQAD